ncbi:Fc.00g071620.m01.CDS01 [Cosmosporella sp. VM-42]
MADSEEIFPARRPYVILGWDMGNEDFVLSLQLNGVGFTIAVSPDKFRNSPVALAEFQHILNKIEVEGAFDSGFWDYAEKIADLWLPEFERLAPSVVHHGTLTLAHLAQTQAFECEFRVVDEIPILASPTTAPEDPPDVDCDIRTLQSSFPIFRPEEVEVPYDDPHHIHEITPRRVFVKGKHLFYKGSWSPYDPIHEIDKYTKITASGLSFQELRTSRAYGIVANSQGHTKGVLYDWIDTKESPARLTWVVTSDTPLALREKWSQQIKDTVAKLHQLGVIWGNINSDNVLIDKDGNAVVINLEDGTAEGWVDRDNHGSLQGDIQGLERMMDFIFNNQSPLRRKPFSDDEGEED